MTTQQKISSPKRLTLKSAVKKILSRIGIKRWLGIGRPFISNVNHSHYNKKCLIAYITYPFTVPSWMTSESHQNKKQVIEMARVIGTFGYDVDVADFANVDVLRNIKTKYDLIIDIHVTRTPGFWSNNMNAGCKLVIYSTGSSMTFSYAQEHKRLDDLERRRGVRLKPCRGITKPEQEKIIETANAFGTSETHITFTLMNI